MVLGFDALSIEYLDAFGEVLPNFSAFRANGVEAPLRSTVPPWTGSAWPSMYTGAGPGHHGVYGFFDYDGGYPDDASVISRDDVRLPAIWNYLSELGHSSIVCNVPVTHPVEPIEGVMIPGYLATEDEPGYPAGIRDELNEVLGTYQIYSSGELASDSQQKLDGYVDLIEMRADAARWLLENREWRFALFQVQKTDSVFHNFDDPAAFRRVYRAADEFLGTVLDAVGPDANVVICSDHGIGPTRGQKIYINEILREHGFVTPDSEATQVSLASEKATLVGDGGDQGDSDRTHVSVRALTSVARGLERVGVGPGNLYTVAKRMGLGGTVERLVGPELRDSIRDGVDWHGSKAFCRSAGECGIRINLEGRESDGVVPLEEYDEVREGLIEILSSIRTPDGDPAFEFVRPREEVYDGAHVEDACDIVFLPRGMDHSIATSLLGKQFVPVEEYDHERDGVFLAAGPDVRSNVTLDRLSLTDVAPTVMALLDVAVPERMTGTVPPNLLSKSVERDHYSDVTYAGGRSASDSEGDVEARLADLGYL